MILSNPVFGNQWRIPPRRGAAERGSGGSARGFSPRTRGETSLPLASALLPGWLSAKAAVEAPAAPLRPSRLGRTRESERVNEGRLAHALLQMLPDIAPERRPAAAKAYLDAHGGALGVAAREALAAQVLGVIEAPELAPLFGPGSRGEVSLAGVLRRSGRADAPYSGRLDRLLVTETDGIDRRLQTGRCAVSPVARPCRPARRLSRGVAADLSDAARARRARLSRRPDASAD